MSMLIAEVARIIWGPDFVGYRWSTGSFSIGGLEVEWSKAAGAVVALITALAIDYFIRRT